MQFIIKTLEGLEDVLAREVEAIGGKEVTPLTRAVSCRGDLKFMYRANLELRTALKVLAPLSEVRVMNETQLYTVVNKLPWEEIFDLNQTFAVDSTTNSALFTHSHYAGLKVKDAIADRFRSIMGARPNVNPVSPEIGINVHIRHDMLTLSLDSSGPSLHMRGYRINTVPAPLNEVLAAGLILLSGWDGKESLADPMCGSGTILIEAAKYMQGLPPHKRSRSFSFQNWKNFDANLWAEVVENAFSPKSTHEFPKLYGGDKSIQAIKATEINAGEAGVLSLIELKRGDFFKQEEVQADWILTNPPYDERLKLDDAQAFYSLLGDQLKNYCVGSKAWILCGNTEAAHAINLKPNKKFALNNGSIESKFYNFEIYEGSRTE